MQAAQLKRAALAEALHGRLVERRIRDQRTRRTQTRRGRLVFKGADYAPHFFAMEYVDGGQEAMSLPVAQRWLLPASASMGQVEAARVVLQPDALPASWNLADAEQLRRALQLLMPGDWQQRVVTKLARQLALSYADAAVGAIARVGALNVSADDGGGGSGESAASSGRKTISLMVSTAR
jgi:hypothetical protein